MFQDVRVLEDGEELSAHWVRDDTVLQSKYVQGGHQEGGRGIVEPSVFLTRAPEPCYEDGEVETELWLQVLLLERTQHGHESCSLAEAEDTVKRAQVLHSLSHSCHALVEPQALLALLLCAEAPCLGVREPPPPGVLVTPRARL